MKFTIKNRWNGSVLFEMEAEYFKEVVEQAVKIPCRLAWCQLAWCQLVECRLAGCQKPYQTHGR